MLPDMGKSDLCKFLGKSPASAILKKASVLILDEVSMMNKVDLERIEHSLRVLMGNDRPYIFYLLKPHFKLFCLVLRFGGKFVILSGDFRQILPVQR